MARCCDDGEMTLVSESASQSHGEESVGAQGVAERREEVEDRRAAEGVGEAMYACQGASRCTKDEGVRHGD